MVCGNAIGEGLYCDELCDRKVIWNHVLSSIHYRQIIEDGRNEASYDHIDPKHESRYYRHATFPGCLD